MYSKMDRFSSSSSSSLESFVYGRIPVPEGYEYLQVLGEGGYGKVIKCVKQDTGEAVAIKISRRDEDLGREAKMLLYLMDHKMDEFNVIKFHGKLKMKRSISLVFEVMDITLMDYLIGLDSPMRLEDIRAVIQQMATAFSGLKRIGVIHTDVKLDNIMMVDHKRQPFKVKLVDFGLSIFRRQAKPGRMIQTRFYRAPEIMLGLPFSEAIDIWSLGCVMAIMVFGFMLFPVRVDFDALKFIIDLMGPPPDHLLNAAWKTMVFFTKRDSDKWVLKTPEEYWGSTNYSTDDRFYKFRSLDEVKTMRLEDDNETEAEERDQCIELLKAMLKWDEKERITPEDILNHPFITKSYLRSSSSLRFNDGLWKPSAAGPSGNQTRTRIEDTPDEYVGEDSKRDRLLSGVIIVRPADPQNRIALDEPCVLDNGICPNPATEPANRTHQCKTDPPPTTDDDGKKKKKNCINRIISWMLF